ncbi:beta-lactamase family protein [Pelagibacterales bacterium SAG-MED31]|nr:beta-lactamase family protein [Pelagibacterales bacterium SAG-MED31]
MDQLNKIFMKHIDEVRFPGIQWQINIKNKVYSGKVGYNNIETKEPVLDNNIYRIWSMTKPVVAVAALQLLEQNKMQLDDLITKYLPEFSKLKVLKNSNSSIDDVEDLKIIPTIKDLFLHTAGFSYNFLPNPIGKQYDEIKLFHSDITTLEEEIKKLSEVPLLYQPRYNWVYSVSMDVLGRILEVILNDSLQNILQRNIFNPLEMHETKFTIPMDAERRVMKTYEYDQVNSKLHEQKIEPQKIGNYKYPLYENNYARGGHGLFSTINDFSIFIKMLHSGKSINSHQILENKTLKLIHTNALEDYYFPIEIPSIGIVRDVNYVNDLQAYGWGYGCRTLMSLPKNNNLGSLGEFGWAGAASTYFLVDNSKEMSALLMTQVLNGSPELKKDFYKFIYTNF